MMDKMLEEFNNWVDLLSMSEIDDLCERSAWQAWQASRQALVVELPDMPYYDFDIFELQDALDEVGVKCEWVKK